MTHSLLFAGLAALLCTVLMQTGRKAPFLTFAFLFTAAASHGLLDCLTDGGKGIALLWPFSDERFFAPLRTIRVSPIGLSNFLSERGWTVLQSELLWIWLPGLFLAFGLRACRTRRWAW
jgi:inner membrane protein